MDMDYYSPTQFLQSPPAIRSQASGYEPPKSSGGRLHEHTLFAVLPEITLFSEPKAESAGTAIEKFRPVASPRTSLLNEDLGLAREVGHVNVARNSVEEIDTIANNRVRLLAANYVGGQMSTEIAARLEILDRRMLERAPRITHQHVEVLETANALLERIQQSRVERKKRLGMVG
jgi:hypothetical protein